MKRYVRFFSLVSAVMLMAFSCEDLVDIVFTSKKVNVELTVPKTIDITKAFDVYDTVTFNLKEEMEAQEADMDLLEKITIKTISISLVSGATTFDIVDNLELYASLPAGSDSVKLAWVESVAKGETELVPEATTKNLIDFVSEGMYLCRLIGRVNQELTDDLVVKVTIEYEIQV